MRTIWKYPIFIVPSITIIYKPKGAILRYVGIQGPDPCVWFEVENTPRLEECIIKVFGTGQPIPDDGQYLGTCQQYGYVWHLYEFREN